MTKLAWLCVMVVAIPPLACTTPADESSDAPELIGSAKAEICYFTSAPPAGFTADVARSLDGSATIVESDGYSGPGNCDYYTMDLDTSPDRAESVSVRFETSGECEDAGEHGAFMWKRLGSGATASWSYQNIPLDDEYDEYFDLCKWSGHVDNLSTLYTRIIVAANGRNPDGSPVAPRLVAHEEDSSADFVFPPVLCPVGTAPPIPDAFRSLDGSTTQAVHSGVPAAAGCDFVTMSVDTDPDRGQFAYFDVVTERCEDLDVDSVELYLWKRLGTGPYYSWSHERVYPWISNHNEGNCTLRGGVNLSSPNSYTQVVLAGRAVTDAGGPIVSMSLAVTE